MERAQQSGREPGLPGQPVQRRAEASAAALLAACLAWGALGSLARTPGGAQPDPEDVGPGARMASPAALDVEQAGLRELRGLPGIGARRALQVGALRWRRGGELPLERWSDLPGIGARTLQGVRRALERISEIPAGPIE